MSVHPFLPPNPFVGLRPFESQEALLFFGRVDQTIELLEQLHQHRFLSVVGSSGCGKSSLIRAGLIPKLQAGMLVEDRDRWFIAVMKPGDRPRENLAAALLQALPADWNKPDKESLAEAIRETGISAIQETFAAALNEADGNLLLLVDQFEEIFRFGVRTEDRACREDAADFVALMLDLVEQRTLPIYVVMTMRSDFLGDCDAFHGLPEAMNRSQYLVPRLTRKQLRAVIEGPARLYGKTIAPRLVDRLLNDVGDESDELPVMQHALMRLWEKGQQNNDQVLDLEHYDAIGTIQEALSRHAEEALAGLDGNLTERLFQTLTHTDESNRRVRRSIHLKDIEAETGANRDSIVPIIEAFRGGGRSFLTPAAGVSLTGDTLIDISHESLIRQWKKLRDWVDTEAEAANKYRRFSEAAERYKAKRGSLLVDLDLKEALDWRQETKPNEAWAERYGEGYDDTMRFLEESHRQEQKKKAQEKQRQEELEQAQEREKNALQAQVELGRRHARQARRFIIFLSFIVVLVSALGVFAFWQAREARNQADLARQQTHAANYNLAKVFEEKAGTALEDAIDNKEPDQNYQKAWLYTLTALAQDIGPERRLLSSVGRLLRPEMRSGAYREIWRSPTPGSFYSVAFSPDGTRLASGSSDQSIRLWDVETGEALATLSGHTAEVWSVAFSPDGTRLASGSLDQSIRLWDVETGEALATLSGHTAEVLSVAFSPDGTRLASGSSDQSIRLWNLVGLGSFLIDRRKKSGFDKIFRASLHLIPYRLQEFRLVPTERPLFLTPLNGYQFPKPRRYQALDRPRPPGKDPLEWILENTETGEMPALSGHMAGVWSVAFSPDGRGLASGSSDQSIRLWDVEISEVRATLSGHTGPVWSVAFSPDGKRLASGSTDRSIRLWDVQTGEALATLSGHTGPVWSVAFSPDGKRLAAGSKDRSIRLWNVETGEALATLSGHRGAVRTVVFSPDGMRLASGSDDKSIRLWDVETGEVLATLDKHTYSVWSVAFSPDGKRLASGSWDHSVRLWDVETGQALATLKGHTYSVWSVAFSSDGKRLASGSWDQTIRLWDVETGQVLATLSGHTGPVWSVAFNPEGKRLASGSADRSIRLWNMAGLNLPKIEATGDGQTVD